MDKKHENRKKDDKDPVEPKPEKNEAEEELVPEETVTLKQDEFQQVRDHITKLEGERDEMKIWLSAFRRILIISADAMPAFMRTAWLKANET